MQNRLEIERALLGAIIYCDAYPQVAHILTGKNFTSAPGARHRELFEAAARLAPARPIDMITVAQEIRTVFQDPDQVLDVLYSCSHVVGSINVPYWAVMLLQIDISEKFKANLVGWKSLRDNQMEHAESGALLEVIETLNANEDVFQLIESAILYFDKMSMDHECHETKTFYQALTERTNTIKRMHSMNTALRFLFSMTEGTNSQVKEQCEVFARAIADMITTGQTNERYTNAAKIIYN